MTGTGLKALGLNLLGQGGAISLVSDMREGGKRPGSTQ